MYVCICNALTEKQVDDAIQNGADSTGRVYEHHACSVRCGKCVREVADRIRHDDGMASKTGLPIMDSNSA